MAGFADVLLRGVLLALTSLVLGGVVWTRAVLRAGPGVKPEPGSRLALRTVAAAAALAAGTQAALVALVSAGAAPDAAGAVLDTTFARTAAGRAVRALAVAGLAARLARRPAGRAPGGLLAGGAAALVASSAFLGHAMARLEGRAGLLALDATHQAAVAVWVGGLAHLTLGAARRRREPPAPGDAAVVRRFSAVALAAVATLALTGIALARVYVGDAGGLVGTAYGVMVATKVLLLAAALGPAWLNFLAVRRAAGEPGVRLFRLVEVELGLALTALLTAASLTSLPPAVDVRAERATAREVLHRFVPAPPRLTSPPITALLADADPLLGEQVARAPVERQWSEYNHHWAGAFVLAMGLLAFGERRGIAAARHWPLLFLGLAAFVFVRGDPRAWPLGPAGFWESMWLPDVLQHRLFVLIIAAFGIFEWAVRTGRLARRPWVFVFPMLCAAGAALLLTHSHAMLDLKAEFLVEVSHVPIGILGALAGWARWLELRLPGAGRAPGWIWRGALVAVGALLLFYREA